MPGVEPCRAAVTAPGRAVPVFPWWRGGSDLAGHGGRKQAQPSVVCGGSQKTKLFCRQHPAQFLEGLLGLKGEVGNGGIGLVGGHIFPLTENISGCET